MCVVEYETLNHFNFLLLTILSNITCNCYASSLALALCGRENLSFYLVKCLNRDNAAESDRTATNFQISISPLLLYNLQTRID